MFTVVQWLLLCDWRWCLQAHPAIAPRYGCLFTALASMCRIHARFALPCDLRRLALQGALPSPALPSPHAAASPRSPPSAGQRRG